ncbi:hypothetical protein TELCIR_09684 [Teladorsagia circumcincta]|uniref:Bestrophin homolog n=1 Tax=Teladorsagia circumcincta TaxID=45464 RepID=A0A2G9UE74_TELCI|nr:hypothetical protein TELCIR_09684 [Teladorsagia circumcincta]
MVDCISRWSSTTPPTFAILAFSSAHIEIEVAVCGQLLIWTVAFLLVSCMYRYVLSPDQQNWFEHLVKYLDSKLDSNIPLTFMLGFFVSFVVGRWGSILNGIGWIDEYMVLCQALVLRDISMQVRKRFPTMDTLAASGK